MFDALFAPRADRSAGRRRRRHHPAACHGSGPGERWKNRLVVSAADSGREFSFARTEPFAGTVVWRYRFDPVEGGTRVTEGYEVERPVRRRGWFVIERVFRGGNRREELRAGMETTLERLEAAAESPTARPS